MTFFCKFDYILYHCKKRERGRLDEGERESRSLSLRELQNKCTSHLNHANFNFAISKNTHGAPVQPFHVHRQKEKKVLFVFTRNMMTKTAILFE